MTSPSFARRLFASLVAGLATGVVVFAILFLAYYIAEGAAINDVGGLVQAFGPSAVVVIVVLVVAALLGALANWRRALATGVVVGILGPYVGTVVFLVIHGSEFTLASDNSFRDLLGYNLVFVVVALVATLTIAKRVYRWAFGLRVVAPPELHRTVLVRPPASTVAKGQLTHVKRRVVKYAKAQEQWEGYVAALEAEGFTALTIDQDDAYPDSVFIEDAVVMLGQVAVVTSPGASTRQGEEDAVADAVTDLGLEVRHIRAPGTLDGGDVLKIRDTIYVGRGGRTNAEGIRQFRAIATELGYRVIAVPVTKALHLKSAVTALPDGTVIGHPTLVDDPGIFPHYLEVPEPAGVAVVVLTNNSVLMAASAPKTAALIESLGYRVTTVDIGEFEKLEGCVTCLSVRIR
ncbi:MAG TPA: dimethylarginine dimethylaminohydrolase [Galbitalea sp.]|jgi:dimethylargininase|nr:dimethylarginine dimethylaminohydrolase [Galbitalea sp.]